MATVMTTDEYVRRLKTVANRKTFYKNKYPYNLLYIHPDGRTSGDCNNTVKAILNGYDVNRTDVGYYQRNLSVTGDCTEYGLLKQCSDISKDFKKLLAENTVRLLYMSGHIGSFVGSFFVDNKEYNVIECTGAWGGGILYTYVNEKGERFRCKGGQKNGKWTQHGKLDKFLTYSVNITVPDYSKYPVLKKGSKGEYVKILQRLLLAKGYDPKGIDGDFGNNTLSAVKKFQTNNTDINGNKLVVDGCVGQKTWGSLYK